MASRHASMLAATGVLLLALTACGGDDEPSPTTPAASTTASSETPTESPSPSTSAPAVAAPDPADYPGMDQQTEEGADAFHRFFWNSYIYMMVSGDTSIMKKYSSAECSWCASEIEKIDEHGPQWESGSIDVTDSRAIIEVDETQAAIQFLLSINPRDDVLTGNTSDTTDAPIDAASQLQWVDSHWMVEDVGVQDGTGQP